MRIKLSGKLYNKDIAEIKLSDDKKQIIDLFLPFAQKMISENHINAFLSSNDLTLKMEKFQKEIPNGWYFELYGNVITIRYMDGEQESDKTFYVPSINVYYADFMEIFDDEQISTEIIERLPLGFCSCGKKMIPVYYMLNGQNRIKKGGVWNKLTGYTLSYIFSVYLCFSSKWRIAIQFNRHHKCL